MKGGKLRVVSITSPGPYPLAKEIEPTAKVQGTVRQIQVNGGPGATTVMILANNRMIYCNAGAKWAGRLRKLNTGDQISMQGKIARYQNGAIFFLEECEVLP